MGNVYTIKPPSWHPQSAFDELVEAVKSGLQQIDEVCLEAADVEDLRAKGYEVSEVTVGRFSKISDGVNALRKRAEEASDAVRRIYQA